MLDSKTGITKTLISASVIMTFDLDIHGHHPQTMVFHPDKYKDDPLDGLTFLLCIHHLALLK